MLSFLTKNLFQAVVNSVVGLVLTVGMFVYFTRSYNLDGLFNTEYAYSY